MGKIKKAPSVRHNATASKEITQYVSEAASVPLVQLPRKLAQFPAHWPYPRGDLYHWIPLLDRFDHILELFNREYALDSGPQVQQFARRLLKRGDAEEPNTSAAAAAAAAADDNDNTIEGFSADGDRELIEEILRFTRLLLERCGNRSLYSSSVHINSLLNTTSLTLLQATLQLSLRLAQRYYVAKHKHPNLHSQGSLMATHYNINLPNMHCLASPLPKPDPRPVHSNSTSAKQKEKPTTFEPNDLVALAKNDYTLAERKDIGAIGFRFAPTSTKPQSPDAVESERAPGTPTPTRRTTASTTSSASSSTQPTTPGPQPVSRTIDSDSQATPTTPRASYFPPPAHTTYEIPWSTVHSTPISEIVQDAIAHCPSDKHYLALHFVRAAKAFNTTDRSVQLLLNIRLLAIANLAYVLNDSKFYEKIGAADTDQPRRLHLAQQLCDLLQPAADGSKLLPLTGEAVVLDTLEALAHTKHKAFEVVDALAVSVNHGVIYYELRRAIASLKKDDDFSAADSLAIMQWRGAVFDLVTTISQMNHGHMKCAERMVNAGIIEILVEALTLRTTSVERTYEKIIGFLSSFVHGITTAFQALANAHGLETISELAYHQTELGLERAKNGQGMTEASKSKVVDYTIPYYQQATLRSTFKFIVHLFDNNAGVHDRLLRNLLDSPKTLGALRTIIANVHIYGSNVWDAAVNTVSNFIHNEPTSFQVIAEAGLARGILEAVTQRSIPDLDGTDTVSTVSKAENIPEVNGTLQYPEPKGIPPVSETICDIPTAFGAICLNEDGMRLFRASGALHAYFDIFLSPAHVRTFDEESQTAFAVGNAFDELSRHHPDLKDEILEAVVLMLKRVRSIAQSPQNMASARLWCEPPVRPVGAADSPNTDDNGRAELFSDLSCAAPALPFITTCLKFLEGFFNNSTMCQKFCRSGGAMLILDIILSPAVPHDSTHPGAYSRAERILHRMCGEKPHLVLPDILARSFMALDVLNDFMEAPYTTQLIKHAMDPSAVTSISAHEGRVFVQALVNVLLLCNVLSGIFAVAPFAGRDGNTSVPLGNLNFTDAYADLLVRFGKLQTACTWDSLELSSQIPSAWKLFVDHDMHSPFSLSDCNAHHERGCLVCKFDGMHGVDDLLEDLNDSHRPEKILALKNARTLYFLFDQVPRRVTSFFSNFSSSLAPKRSAERYQKQHAHYLAEKLADVLIDAVTSRRHSTSSEAISELYTQHALWTAYMTMLRVGANTDSLNTKHALTLILWKFHLAQGFVELDKHLTDLVDMCYGPYSADPRHLDAIHTSINTILNLYTQATANKVINDASQSFLIENDDTKSTEYFDSRQFLVELRHTVLKSIASLWRSADLSKLGTNNAKLVIEIVRNVLRADGEERTITASDGYMKRVAPTPERADGFKVNVIEELNKTYKPRLFFEGGYRCCNQEPAIKEYCELGKQYHGPRFPPPSSSAESDHPQASRATEAMVPEEGEQQLVLPLDDPSRSESTNPGYDEPVWIYRAPENPVRHILESREPFITTDDLNEQRAIVRDDLVDRCLDVLSTEPTLTFELADLIQAAVSKSGEGANPRAEVGKTLVSSLLSLQGEVESEQSAKKVTGYAHLVALILQDRDFFDSTLDELKEYFDSFVSWISLGPEQSVESAPWIEMVLLIIERVLAEDEQPVTVEWVPPPEDDPLKPLTEAQLPEPAISIDSKTELFNTLTDLLPKIGKDHSLALSVTRVLVILTRNRSLSRRFADKLLLSRLFVVVRQLARPLGDKLQTAFMIILRHVVEDDATIEQIMKTEIKTFFDSSRSGSRAIDTTTYIHNLYHLILRDAKTFVKVTQELVEVSNYNGNPVRPQHLVLKKPVASAGQDSSDDKQAENASAETGTQSPVEVFQPPIVESSDGVIHFLLRELSNFREVEDKPSPPKPAVDDSADTRFAIADSDDVEMGAEPSSSGTGTRPAAQSDSTQQNSFRPEEHVIFIYRCFLMQCLAELLACYSRCKIDFISFSRKGDAPTSTPSKPRSGTINYLLNQLLPIGTLEHLDTIAHRKKAATSDWATTVIVALCSQTHEKPYFERHASRSPELKPEEPELSFVRRFVLEHALRSFKEAITAAEDRDLRYSRMLALSDLFDRMLNTKQDRSNQVQTAIFARSALQIGRLMYEKNFVGVLTSSIAEIELDFANAKRAVKHILAPLKTLTGLAVDLSQRGELSSSTPGTSTEGEDISSATSVSDGDEDEEEREQTPDLFRNSALSMFEASANDERSSDSDDIDNDDEDEEMYDDDFDGEMGYEDDNGETVSDEEVIEGMEGMHGLGDIEGLPGDVEVQIIHDDEEIDDDDDDDDDNSDSDSENEMDEDDEDEDGMSGHDHEDGAELDSSQSFIDGMEELEGEDDNASMAELEAVWEEGADYGDVLAQEDDDSPHGGPLEHLAHVLGVNNHSDHETRIRVIHHDHDPETGEYFEDEMAPGDDDDEDNDEGEDEPENDLAYEPEIEEDEDGDSPWDALHNFARSYGGRWHHRPRVGGPDGFENLMSRAVDLHSRVSTRFHARGSHPSRVEDEGLNPLLQRSEPSEGSSARRDGLSIVHGLPPHVVTANTRRLNRDMAGNALITDLVSAMNRGTLSAGHLSRFSVTVEGNGRFLELDPNRTWRQQLGVALPGQSQSSSRHEALAVDFKPAFTAGRWEDEARILFGMRIRDKATRVLNALFRVLLPQAMEAKRIKDAEDAVRKAAEEKAREEARKAEVEKAEREAQEKKEKEEREAREAREAQALLEESAAAEINTEMEGVEQTGNDDEAAAPTEPPPATDRIMTTIRGRQVDITDLGIDHEYLQALPEEFREEVIMSQLTEQRSQAHQAGEAPQEISPEFLEALPAELQQELLRQEAIERRRRERAESRRQNADSASAQPAQAQDIDPADFLAMLDPNLRQQILIDAHEDEGYFNELPEELQREARILNERRAPGLVRHMIQATHPRIIDINSSNREAEQAAERVRPKQIVQMLDKAGVATLLRLMFVNLNHKAKTSLHAVLSDVCKNTQNRAEVISILLTILQDCTADVNAVERSFTQLSLRAKQQAGAKTPQPLKRTPTNSGSSSTELSPLTIVQHCLGTLAALSADNPKVQTFFLSEHETAASQKAKTGKKSKVKDTKSSKYPLNALLMLLDRKLITENTGVMETLASLLSRVTLPLQILLKKAKEAQEAEREAEAAQSSAAEQATADQPPADPMEISMADVRMQEAPPATQPSESGQADTSEAATANQEGKKKRSARELEPPNVPEENIRLVVNILAARECPSKTFSDTLDIIKHMAAIPGAKEVFGRELIRQAQELGADVVTDLDALAEQISNAQGGADIQGMALASLSSAGSKQRKLLRILVALDHLFDSKRMQSTQVDGPAIDAKLKDDILASLYESENFQNLWKTLSTCLTAIRQRTDMVNIATILLPLIESLMVVCRNSHLKDIPLNASQADVTVSTPPPEAKMEGLFFNFTEEHRKILNELIRNNPKLMNGNLSILAKNSKVLEFDNKRSYFNRKVHNRGSESRSQHPALTLNIRRDQAFMDSYKALYYKSGDEIKNGKLNIRFNGEEGIDAGGVSREWFAVMARQMFNPGYALFNPVASDRTTFHPNSLSGINKEHLSFFKFIGRVIGKALYEGRVLDCHFSRAVYRRILGKSVSLKDMETLDLEYYKSLVWMLENDITDIAFETFSVQVEGFGVTEVVDLIENGRNVPVTEENKHDYVRLVVEHRLIKSVQDQLDAFLKGFHDIIPSDLISIFNEQELELLISGLPDIDVDDWKNNTEYHNFTATSAQIQWFWRAVKSFDPEERAKLLQFVTGTSKVPLNGFKELEGMNGFARFNIHRDYSSKDRLPTSHTCFNQLDLPEYESYEQLRQQLYFAITAGSEYFGFA